ncbi:MAG TPA: lipopolysaccharide heptosyltransferase II [Bryobacteraceae bacterium]|nr:lipopolysaccharide heptosyltransferase II [Bryobacteraceae bacterium]
MIPGGCYNYCLPRNQTKILIRATNWVGDAVMSLPAVRAVREAFPGAQLTVLARAAVADLYAREGAIDRVMLCADRRRRTAAELRRESFDCAILLPNSFDAALAAWMGRIPRRIGYRRDGRGWLLTDAIPPPEPGEIPRHERFYYLELLRRAGIIHEYPACSEIRLDGREAARAAGLDALRYAGLAAPVVGISPGAAYGDAKRWLPERFAETAVLVARAHAASVALFGAAAERELCESVAAAVRADGIAVRNFAGQTSLRQFIDLAAACRLFLTNDSGAMHVVAALEVPTVTVFGATDDTTTGPTGAWARVVREQVECSPCLLRACPIDHRCMTRVTTQRVAAVALDLLDLRGEKSA